MKLGEEIRGKRVVTVADFVQTRRFGKSTIVVVDFGPMGGGIWQEADRLYAEYVEARKQSDEDAIKVTGTNFSNRTGFLADVIYDLAVSMSQEDHLYPPRLSTEAPLGPSGSTS